MSKKKYPPYHVYQGLTDSHTHLLHMKEKGIDLNELFEYLSSRDFSWILDAGVKETDFSERLALSSLYEGLYFSAGIHPEDAGGNLTDRREILRNQCRHEKVIAVGEIGLDYYWKDIEPAVQKDFFAAMLELACEENLPVIIHNREADRDCLDMLNCYSLPKGGVMHCFSSDRSYAGKILDRGFYLSFAGNVTYKSALNIQEAAQYTPKDRILVETDAPYLSPQQRRGRTNHTGQIGYTLDFLAELRQETPEELTDNTRINFQKLFLEAMKN